MSGQYKLWKSLFHFAIGIVLHKSWENKQAEVYFFFSKSQIFRSEKLLIRFPLDI